MRYRKAALSVHPDKREGATDAQAFLLVTEARDVLPGDPATYRDSLR